MSYASLSDLEARAGRTEILQVADRDGDGVADAEVVLAALTQADVLIDGYVRVRYPQLAEPVPELVRGWAVSIARYTLHRDGAPDHVTNDYKAAIAALKDLSRGLISLPLSADQTATNDPGRHASSSPAEVFTDRRLAGWR